MSPYLATRIVLLRPVLPVHNEGAAMGSSFGRYLAMTKSAPVVSLGDLPLQAYSRGEGFQAEIARLGFAVPRKRVGIT